MRFKLIRCLKRQNILWVIVILVVINFLFILSTKFQTTIPVFKREPRIFCFILTQSTSVGTRARAAYNAWAHKCDNYKFVIKFPTNMTEDIEILMFASKLKNISESEGFELNDLVEPANFGEDKYKNLTNKVFRTFIYLYKKYDYYDWYLKADDDTFVLVDNMRKFLADKDPRNPVTYGYNYKSIVDFGYHSGGAGYLLSNEALKRIGKKLNTNISSCSSTGTEDVDVARCLRTLGVRPGNSTDNLGRERFHPLSIYDRYNGVIYEWLEKYAQNKPEKGLKCCSDTSIAFHYMDIPDMVKLAKILDDANKEGIILTFKQIIEKILNIKTTRLYTSSSKVNHLLNSSSFLSPLNNSTRLIITRENKNAGQ